MRILKTIYRYLQRNRRPSMDATSDHPELPPTDWLAPAEKAIEAAAEHGLEAQSGQSSVDRTWLEVVEEKISRAKNVILEDEMNRKVFYLRHQHLRRKSVTRG